MSKKKPQIALVHDFLIKLGGAERVLQVLSDIYPEAPIYTLLYDEEKVGKVFPRDRIRFSSLQRLPQWLRRKQRYLLPSMPKAVEAMDFSSYDIVLSSSSAFAHGIITNTDTQHYCYCHSPMRYAWDWTHEYLEENAMGAIKKTAARLLLNKIRMWDQIAGDRPDHYIANSQTVQKRIKKYYKKESSVIYPPVDIKRFNPRRKKENFFLIVSTITPYKKIDLAIHLFNKIGKELIIIGDGPQRSYLQSIAAPNIHFLGFKSDKEIAEYYRNARAFIFPGEEDFGITPVEAMACATPVLAYGKGGVTETVLPGITGEFFTQPTIQSMEQGLARLLTNEKNYTMKNMTKRAQLFDTNRFIKEIRKKINI
ncbi:glycosyltransferase [Candidatus Peregrinibacteria bacterium]|nr:glycosyltransferase [Candidatus Peregrinibacteria bacterium]